MDYKQLHEQWAKDFHKYWNRYVQLHKDLDLWRGKEITAENVKSINKIIEEMQISFEYLWEPLNFIQNWHAQALNALNEHKKFMDDIKAAGGEPVYDDQEDQGANA